MAAQHTSKSPESIASPALSRRHFLQGSGMTAAGVLGLLQGHPAQGAPVAASGSSPRAFRRRPNFLILMVDEMRYPPVYESAPTKAFRQQYLLTQNLLRQHGVEFHRHYAASVACSPSRASLYTGHYPSLHGVTETTGAAKEAFDPDVFWLDPNSVPTFGDYFRAAGYRTFWKGKWHASDADIVQPEAAPAVQWNGPGPAKLRHVGSPSLNSVHPTATSAGADAQFQQLVAASSDSPTVT